MTGLGLEREVRDRSVYEAALAHFRLSGLVLPTFAQLAAPETIPASIQAALAEVNPDTADPLNLFRVHWHNGAARHSTVTTPDHVVLPQSLTGVAAPIVVLFGNRFPMIRAHKVLAAYACLVPRLVTGQFDPARQRAIWPSTGNYCRGGIAISRMLGCRGVAVLPEGMSRERFDWLEQWVSDPADIVRTPGTESNVKEIYDRCELLAVDPANVVLNQFSEFGNYLAHVTCTSQALTRVFLAEQERCRELSLAAFVSATGSAGTLGAGDVLKQRFGSLNVAVEALQCPTMLYNGFGEHNIQGIGDKHIPLIHNVTNTDLVCAVSDVSTDSLLCLFNTDVGREVLAAHCNLAPELLRSLANMGLSSIANVLASIQTAMALDLDETQAILTVATDGAELYRSEIDKATRKHFGGSFDADAAAGVLREHIGGVSTQHLLRLTPSDRDRIFNLGYFTWVEQRGVSIEAFEARREQSFWSGLREVAPEWDCLIEDFNGRTR